MMIICAEIRASGVTKIDRVEITPKLFDISGIVAKTQTVDITMPSIIGFAAPRNRSIELIGCPTKIIARTAINERLKLNSKSIVGENASITNAAVHIEFSCEYLLRVRWESCKTENIIAARIALVGYPHSAT